MTASQRAGRGDPKHHELSEPEGPPLPTFLVIGAMRCGTTSLARYLGAHPEVFIAPVKEVHYFDRNYELGERWYRDQFKGYDGEPQLGEATQNYLYDPEPFERLADLLPDAKLVVSLRDPVERAYSHYWHKVARGREPLSFEDALDAEAARLASGDPEARDHFSYLDRGHYLPQLERVVSRYPREQVHVLLFEDLRDRPTETFQQLCRFLGVADDVVPDVIGEPMNVYGRFRSLRVQQVARRLPAPLAKVVGRLNTDRSGYPPLDPHLRRRLVDQLAGERAALAEWLGRDLSVWER